MKKRSPPAKPIDDVDVEQDEEETSPLLQALGVWLEEHKFHAGESDREHQLEKLEKAVVENMPGDLASEQGQLNKSENQEDIRSVQAMRDWLEKRSSHQLWIPKNAKRAMEMALANAILEDGNSTLPQALRMAIADQDSDKLVREFALWLEEQKFHAEDVGGMPKVSEAQSIRDWLERRAARKLSQENNTRSVIQSVMNWLKGRSVHKPRIARHQRRAVERAIWDFAHDRGIDPLPLFQLIKGLPGAHENETIPLAESVADWLEKEKQAPIQENNSLHSGDSETINHSMHKAHNLSAVQEACNRSAVQDTKQAHNLSAVQNTKHAPAYMQAMRGNAR